MRQLGFDELHRVYFETAGFWFVDDLQQRVDVDPAGSFIDHEVNRIDDLLPWRYAASAP